MGGEIVDDDVNLLPEWAQGHDLSQEGDELATGVAGGGFSVDAAGGRIQRGMQGKRAVAAVLEAVSVLRSCDRSFRAQHPEGSNRGTITCYYDILRLKRRNLVDEFILSTPSGSRPLSERSKRSTK